MINKIIKFFKSLSRKQYIGDTVADFMHKNQDLLVLVADPKTDVIMVGYRNRMTGTAIKPQVGKQKSKVVKSVLSSARFEHDIDRFLLQVDGAIFNIVKDIRDTKYGSKIPSVKVPIHNHLAN